MRDVGAPPTWVLSNHDVVRHVTRYGGGDLGVARARAATAPHAGPAGQRVPLPGRRARPRRGRRPARRAAGRTRPSSARVGPSVAATVAGFRCRGPRTTRRSGSPKVPPRGFPSQLCGGRSPTTSNEPIPTRPCRCTGSPSPNGDGTRRSATAHSSGSSRPWASCRSPVATISSASRTSPTRPVPWPAYFGVAATGAVPLEPAGPTAEPRRPRWSQPFRRSGSDRTDSGRMPHPSAKQRGVVTVSLSTRLGRCPTVTTRGTDRSGRRNRRSCALGPAEDGAGKGVSMSRSRRPKRRFGRRRRP